VGKGAWHEFASLRVLKMLAVSAIALGLMSGAVRAEGIMTYGLGRNACGEWLNTRRTTPEAWAIYSSWLQGFITAVNDVVPKPMGMCCEERILLLCGLGWTTIAQSIP
jgi:hypothetical protein